MAKEISGILKTICCSLGLVIFGLFVHSHFPLYLFSIAGLLITALIIALYLPPWNMWITSRITKIQFKRIVLNFLSGCILGVVIAFLYRNYLGTNLFPGALTRIGWIALSIGISEEIVYRGFIQKWLDSYHWSVSISLASVAHTAYKCSLFILPLHNNPIDLFFLAFWTFTIGLLFGMINHFSKSLLPSATAHAVFDIMVYGSLDSLPWWVW